MSCGSFPYLSKQSLNRYATTTPEGSSSENAASGLATNLTLSFWNLPPLCLIISVSPSHSLSYLLQPLHSSIHSHLHIKSLYPFTHHPHLSDYLTSTISTGSQKWQHDGNIKSVESESVLFKFTLTLENQNQNQNGRSLEDYVDHEARWDDETLKQRFWSGMDDILRQMLLLGEDHCPFIEFIDYPLWVCGSFIPWESLRTTTPLIRTPQNYLSLLKTRHIILDWSVPGTRGISFEEAREAVPPSQAFPEHIKFE